MKDGYKIKTTFNFTNKTKEILVHNYHIYNTIWFIFYSKKGNYKHNKYDPIIGRWNIKINKL